MTPRARWSLALGTLGLTTAIAACLNPQPLPPADARATNADSGASFGGASDASLSASDPETDNGADGSTPTNGGDAGTIDPDAGDGGDAGLDAGDAGEDSTG